MLEKAKADPKTRQLIEERENAARNYASAIADAKFEGMEEGEKLGIEKGEKIAKVESAKRFLAMGLSLEQIAQGTGLSIEDVSNLVH